MNNPSIEQAFIELEEGLKEIKSANENVNSVSQKSEQLIVTMTKVIASLNAISSNVSLDKEVIQDQLTENNKALKTGITKILKDANESYSEIQSKISENQNIFANDLKSILKDIKTKLQDEVENYKSAVQISLDSISKEVEGFNVQVRSVQESTLKFEHSLNELNDRISKTDFQREFDTLNKSLNSKFTFLLAINLFVLLGILVKILFL
jgi:DNA anti-recombination protein RmuC